MAIYSVTFEVEAALLDDAPVLAMVAESKFRRHCERQGIIHRRSDRVGCGASARG